MSDERAAILRQCEDRGKEIDRILEQIALMEQHLKCSSSFSFFTVIHPHYGFTEKNEQSEVWDMPRNQQFKMENDRIAEKKADGTEFQSYSLSEPKFR